MKVFSAFQYKNKHATLTTAFSDTIVFTNYAYKKFKIKTLVI